MSEQKSFWRRLIERSSPKDKPSSIAAAGKCVCTYFDRHVWIKETEERDKCFVCGQIRIK
jgi:hypothetical protein